MRVQRRPRAPEPILIPSHVRVHARATPRQSTPPPPTLDLARRVEKRLSRAHAEEAAKRDAKQVHEGKKHSMPPVFVDNAGDERSLSEWAFSEPKPATVDAEDETDDEASKGDGVIATKASRKRRMVLDDDEEDCEAW